MSGVLIQDGRRSGHRKWSLNAIEGGGADGVVLNPFATPRVSEPRNPSAVMVAEDVKGVNGEVILDAMTHALFLPQTNKLDFYDTWDFWPDGEPALGNEAQQLSHIERVFLRQNQVGVPNLTPTLQLNSPQSSEAHTVQDMGRIARGLVPDCWQSLVGTRSFWSSGSRLDAYIGSLAALRAPVWMITVANEIVADSSPELADTEAFAGLCRSVHSLSLRSRVIVSFGDFAALPAVAAGADTVGSGWDRAQRTFDPLSFHVSSDAGPRIAASYVTQGGLNAVLRRDAADAIERWDPIEAIRIRGGSMPSSDNVERMHHLQQLRSAVMEINSAGADRPLRVSKLRKRYKSASADFGKLITELPRIVRDSDKRVWASAPAQILEAYATSEGM